jgi:hypothetical protein
VKILETRFWEKLVEGSFGENLENKLKRRGPKEDVTNWNLRRDGHRLHPKRPVKAA